jgi:hypothetical protein
VKSRARPLPPPPGRNFFSYSRVSIAPTSGPPTVFALNVKLVTGRPGGVAPWSETFAAAHTMSAGQSSSAVADSVTSRP